MYYIETSGATTTTYQATFDTTVDDCSVVYSLTSDPAPLPGYASIDSTSGEVTISTDSLAFDLKTYTFTVTATSSDSTRSDGSDSTTFVVETREECWDA